MFKILFIFWLTRFDTSTYAIVASIILLHTFKTVVTIIAINIAQFIFSLFIGMATCLCTNSSMTSCITARTSITYIPRALWSFARHTLVSLDFVSWILTFHVKYYELNLSNFCNGSWKHRFLCWIIRTYPIPPLQEIVFRVFCWKYLSEELHRFFILRPSIYHPP